MVVSYQLHFFKNLGINYYENKGDRIVHSYDLILKNTYLSLYTNKAIKIIAHHRIYEKE